MATQQTKTKKEYNADAVATALSGKSVVEVSVVFQDEEGNQETVKAINPNVKLRLAEEGKSDNLWVGGAVNFGKFKAQLGMNLTAHGSKDFNSK